MSVFAQLTSSENIPIIESQMRANNVDSVKCCCDKKCKGLRGLKSHQSIMLSHQSLNKEMVSTNDIKTD